METLKLKITGTSPLMMHSDRLANPLDPATKLHKELTGKLKKVDDDHLAIARSEFIAGCYWNPKDGFHIPGPNFDATLRRRSKPASTPAREIRYTSLVSSEIGIGVPETRRTSRLLRLFFFGAQHDPFMAGRAGEMETSRRSLVRYANLVRSATIIGVM